MSHVRPGDWLMVRGAHQVVGRVLHTARDGLLVDWGGVRSDPAPERLALAEPSGWLGANVWRGRATGLDLLGDRVRVRIDGRPQPSLVAEVTPAAVTELNLVEGSEVCVSVKATDVGCIRRRCRVTTRPRRPPVARCWEPDRGESLRAWFMQAQGDGGKLPGVTSVEKRSEPVRGRVAPAVWYRL